MYVNSQGQVSLPLCTVGSTVLSFDEILDQNIQYLKKIVTVTELSLANLGLT